MKREEIKVAALRYSTCNITKDELKYMLFMIIRERIKMMEIGMARSDMA